MCCSRHNRHQQCGGRRRRGPIVVQLTKMAFDKYQEHKANKALSEALENETKTPEIILTPATSANSLRGVEPPSYEAAVASSSDCVSNYSSSDYGSDTEDIDIQWVNGEGKPVVVSSSPKEQRKTEKAERKAQREWKKNEKALEKAARKAAKQYQ